jgi:hypothetical protein
MAATPKSPAETAKQVGTAEPESKATVSKTAPRDLEAQRPVESDDHSIQASRTPLDTTLKLRGGSTGCIEGCCVACCCVVM